jgi:hypothetical protein
VEKIGFRTDNPEHDGAKTPEGRGSTDTFPAKDYWEELHSEWEGGLGEDPLGADHAGRFATIESAWRAGLLGPEAEAAIITREQIAKIGGTEGEVLRDFMRLVEPNVRERPLVRLLGELRRG